MSKVLSQIKKAIRQRETPVDKITELDISNHQLGQFTPEIKTLIEQCKNLESLALCECDLKSLKNLPVLKKLQELDLSTNSIPDSQLKQLASYKESLVVLSIADNKIEKLDTLKELKNALPNLVRLQCADNPVENLPNYFKNVFALFPKLECLDSKDKNGNDVETADFDDDDDEDNDDDNQEDSEEDEEAGGQSNGKVKGKPSEREDEDDGEDSENEEEADADEDYSEEGEEDEEDE